MRRMAAILAVAIVVTAVAVLESQPRIGSEPVVVELFTSQGCSSCPPADEYLRKLAADPKLRGRVIPLAYHVDYWNSLGWRDPFSSREWSLRQGGYVGALKLGSAYTPQIVVNGVRQMVGSNSFAVQRAIEEESKRTSGAHVTLNVADGAAVIRAESSSPADLMLVTFENGLVTKIGSGENEGRTQTSDAVVRSLVRLGAVKGVVDRRVPLTLAKNAGVAVFLQDPKTLRITAAASRP
jgi:hypothetical protein